MKFRVIFLAVVLCIFASYLEGFAKELSFETLAPPSPFDKQRKVFNQIHAALGEADVENESEDGSSGTMRFPGVAAMEDEAIPSVDDQIQKAIADNRAYPLQGLPLNQLIEKMRRVLLRGEEASGVLIRLDAEMRMILPSSLYDRLRYKIMDIALDVLKLLDLRKAEIWIVPTEGRADREPIGFFADLGSVRTNYGIDASESPFLARRIGNKIFVTEYFYKKFLAQGRGQEDVLFMTAVFHDLLELPPITRKYRVNKGLRHRLAATVQIMMSPDKPFLFDEWTIGYYSAGQLGELLNTKPGMRASNLTQLALQELLRRAGKEDIEAITNWIILHLATGQNTDVVAASWVLKDIGERAAIPRFGDGKIAAPSKNSRGARKVLENLAKEIVGLMNPFWKRRHDYGLADPMRYLARLASEGHIGQGHFEDPFAFRQKGMGGDLLAMLYKVMKFRSEHDLKLDPYVRRYSEIFARHSAGSALEDMPVSEINPLFQEVERFLADLERNRSVDVSDLAPRIQILRKKINDARAHGIARLGALHVKVESLPEADQEILYNAMDMFFNFKIHLERLSPHRKSAPRATDRHLGRASTIDSAL